MTAVPSTPDAYRPIPAGYESACIDTADPRNQAAAVHKAGLTQGQFESDGVTGRGKPRAAGRRIRAQRPPTRWPATSAAAPAR